MYETRVDISGDQLVLTISPAMQKDLKLHQGDRLLSEVPGPQNEVSQPRRRFLPGQLVNEHAEILGELDANREWVDAPAVGREIL